jgi:hypothetical protein
MNLGTSSTYKNKKNVHINMCPETLNLLVISARILYSHQQQFNINVWAGIVDDCLVGPHILPPRLTRNHCQDFLLHDLPNYWKMYHWQTGYECGTCVLVLRHTSAMLREMCSVTRIMTDG